MILALFLGFLIGLSVSAPIGPVSVLCIRRTLEYGRMSGMMSGIGAALADTLYAMVAAFGLTWISDWFIGHQNPLRIFGGIFLLYFGIRMFRTDPCAQNQCELKVHVAEDFFSTFMITLTNPVTILFFGFIFAILGFGVAHVTFSSAFLLVLGVFLGSAGWWIFLSVFVFRLRDKMGQQLFMRVNQWSSIAVILFSLGIIGSVLVNLLK
ncbi:MAG: threonine efflux protein [Parcubacteria group bacterium Gr01-1014_18]|nr:MAG: threonine efflux protein [Parcubacteria group bacterium Greene0416_36]TSC80834.1 MAG: threonine efflux protein [Parcubacteria group bacterium Gr01-1014_18]TSC99495.1 MAG: threonine efflux protein [Parcubacteria group bacterium Greene1014_20]TSD07586.1 MAG: threonine efflux protein [Parcubacteria group bacterium Greene0714_2]